MKTEKFPLGYWRGRVNRSPALGRCDPLHFNAPQNTENEMQTKIKTNLADVIKGMQVSDWEERRYSSGKRKVYVRYKEKEPTITVSVKEG